MSKKICALLLGLSLGVASALGAPTSSEEGLPFIGKYKINRYKFKNGLTLLVQEDHTSPTFAYHTWFRVGSKDEVPKYTGLAHLFEHLMFKATKNHPEGEFDRLLERAGAEGENAFTSNDYTAYIQEMPADKLDLIMELEADRMVNLVVDENAFKTEREVVQNERRERTENSPDGTIYQTLDEVAFTTHPYKWPVIGYKEDLERMTHKDASDFYKKHYSPNNATIVVVGDVDPDAVVKRVEKYYGAIPAQPELERKVAVEPEQKGERRKTLPLNIQVQKLLIGYKVPGIEHPDSPIFEVIQGILSEGKSGRLDKALTDAGITTELYTGSRQSEHPGLFLIGMEIQKGKTAAQADKILQRELARLASTPVDERELAKAKNLLNAGFYDGLGSAMSRARFLGSYETTLRDYRRGLAIQDNLLKVTAADVQRVAKSLFKNENRTVIVGVPK